MKHAIAIRHIAFEDLGTLVPMLQQQNYQVTYLEAGMDDLAEISPLEPDLIVVLGGPIGAYDEQQYPFLLDELHLLEHRLSADRPTLGICLGAQLMARALGATVYSGSDKEIGWAPLQLSSAGQTSALQYLAPEQTPVLHWHGDTFELPRQATHLAATEQYQNQAFSWGRTCLGLQFHPEITAVGFERWLIGHACEIQAAGLNVAELRQETIQYADRLAVQATQLWQHWLHSLA
jgi:GMP synthase (glutamine-hydrolysing)